MPAVDCGPNQYYDGVDCSHCSLACDNAIARNNLNECRNMCKNYYETVYGASPPESKASSLGIYYIDIWLPVVISLCFLVVVAFLLIKYRRRRRRDNHPEVGEEVNNPLTVEATREAPPPGTDSGVATGSSEITYRALSEVNPYYLRTNPDFVQDGSY